MSRLVLNPDQNTDNINETQSNSFDVDSQHDNEILEKQDQYAHLFPDWDLLPPQVLVRRVNRKK